ncbi:MAG: glycosyltransferase family 2 protein [Gammaproteobacteria bacterium]|nr:glycosyltransferase family 2 protein [Gammaproteobacteria bacterium]
MTLPRFSTVICNYNYGDFVADAIESALAQDYPADRHEVIVVDDGSTDASRERIGALAGRPGFTVVLQPNAGQAAAYAAGVARARGDYVCLLDSDDLFLPGKLAGVAAQLERIAASSADLVLFHDYCIRDDVRGIELEASWFATRGIDLGAGARISDPSQPVQIPVPCAQIYGRALAQQLFDAMPTADWKYGADIVLAHAAFLVARRLHYLHEVLGVYRIHGGNEMGGVDGDRVIAKTSVISRWPKRLWYFERVMDSTAGDREARQERLGYLKRIEREVRYTSGALRLREPLVSFVVLAGEDDGALADTLAAVSAQTHPTLEVLVVLRGDAHGAAAHDFGTARVLHAAAGASDIECMALGHGAARGAFLCFVPAGDRPDPVFTERILHVHLYGPPASLCASDVRLIDHDGTLLHSSPNAASAAWRQVIHFVDPLTTPMAQTRFPPLAAVMFRRQRLLERFFDRADAAAVLGAQGPWLLLQLAHALGGSTRLAECLLSHRIEDQSWITAFTQGAVPDPDGSVATDPDLTAACALLLDIYCAAHGEFRAVFPETWHAQFIAWLAHGQSFAARARLRDIARTHGDGETVDLLDAIDELGSE